MTSTGKGRRGALIPAAAAATLAIAGTVMIFGPDDRSPSQPQDSEASQLVAQPAPPTSAAAPGQADPTEARGPGDPGEEVDAPAGEPAPSYPPVQEPWRPVVTGFATDFTQPDPDWSTRLVRWTSDYLTAEYSQLTPDRVPTAALQDIEVVAAGEGVADIVAVYDTGLRLIIRAEDSVLGWKVAKVEQAA